MDASSSEPETGNREPEKADSNEQPAAAEENVTESAAETEATEVAAPANPDQSDSYLRWSYVITRGIVAGLVWSFFAYVFDPMLHRGVIMGGQKAVGAKVEIEGFATEFFPPVIKASNVQIANKFKPTNNLLEFTHFEGHVDGAALLRRAYVIDRGRIDGLQFDTDRKESGQLDTSEPPPADETESPFKAKVEQFGKKWAADLLERAKLETDPRQFESVRLAESLKTEWEGDFDDLKERVDGIEDGADKIKDAIEDKSGNTLDRVQRYQKAAADAAKLLKEADTIRREVAGMPDRARGDLKDLEAARDRDLEKIKEKIDLLRTDPNQLSEFLMGPELYHRMTSTFDWVTWTHERIQELKNQPKPVRSRGEDIEFPHSKPLPKFLLRLLDIMGQGQVAGEPMQFAGTLTGVSSQPQIYADPTVLRLEGKGNGTAQVKATIDLRDEVPKNVVAVFYESDEPDAARLGDKKNLRIVVDSGNLKWRTNVETIGEELSGQIFLIREPVSMSVQLDPDTDPRVSSILQQVIGNINRVEAEVELAGTVKKPTWKLKSNLGPSIADGINGILKKTIDSKRIQLTSYINDHRDTNRRDLINLINTEYVDVVKKLNVNQDKLKNLIPKQLSDQPLDTLKQLFRR